MSAVAIADRQSSWTPRHRADTDTPANGAEAAWQGALARTPDREELFTTMSAAEVPRMSTPESAGIDYATDLGYPGQFPFTRGVYPSMYRGKPWTQRQFAGFGTAAETNERFHYLLAHGQHGLSVAFDMPSLMGYDSDDEHSLGEVGREGVAVDSVLDMERLFEGVPLDEVSTSMTINGPAPIILAYYAVMAENRGIPLAKLSGTIQTDILKEYIAQKEWLFPPDPSMRLVTDMVEFCTKEMPRWHPISISGYHIREAGSTAAQELAFTLANGFAYVEHAIERGLDVDAFAPRLSFFFNAHIDFFEEIAKLRAARRIWATVMRDKYGAKDPRSLLCRFHCQTAGVSLTWQQPLVNVARTAVEAMAAVLGGCQSLHTNSYDEAIALPTVKAATLALRTQQVLAYETDVTATVDPFAGSYVVEAMTDEVERAALELMARVEELGGAVAAIEKGFQKSEIERSAYDVALGIDSGERVVVGLNRYRSESEERYEPLRVDPSIEADQRERLRVLREKRDSAAVDKALAELKEAAAGDGNVLHPMRTALRELATVGEVCGALREVWGTYTPQEFF